MAKEHPLLCHTICPASVVSSAPTRLFPRASFAPAFPMFISILGEELGWRGFLQDALRPLAPTQEVCSDRRAVGVLAFHHTHRPLGQSRAFRDRTVDFLLLHNSP